jgi:hypothetical protein
MVTCTAEVELDSVKMGMYDHATFVLQFNSELGLTASAHTLTLTVETGSGDSNDLADATFNYRWNSATTITASADKLSTWTSASTLTITCSTDAGKMLILELDAAEIPCASKQYEWVTVNINPVSASVGDVEGYCILSNPRYSANIMPVGNA